MSLYEIVNPATVEYLNPKSFTLSNILLVSLMSNNLNTLEITLDKNPLLNGLLTSNLFNILLVSLMSNNLNTLEITLDKNPLLNGLLTSNLFNISFGLIPLSMKCLLLNPSSKFLLVGSFK